MIVRPGRSDPEHCADMVATIVPTVAGKAVAQESVGRARDEGDREASVTATMTWAGAKHAVSVSLAAEREGRCAGIHHSTPDHRISSAKLAPFKVGVTNPAHRFLEAALNDQQC